MPTEPIFSYSAAPQPVKPRTKYRNVGEEAGLTLMSDPRVRRGTTLGSGPRAGAESGAAPAPGGKRNSISSPTKAKTRGGTGHHSYSGDTGPAGPSSQPSYTFEVTGFAGSEFNLDQYLIAADDSSGARHTVNTNQNESCQTDEFVPLPPPAEFVPRKSGVDIYTQVENQQELFDFDAEVKPMVDVIVRKTMEQALFELNSEDELKTLQSEIDRFNIERDAEARWIFLREKETIEDSKFKERERQDRIRLMEVEEGVRRTVGAAAAMRQFMPSVFDAVTKELFEKGVWRDEDREETSATVLPSLIGAVKKKADFYTAAHDMIEELLLRAQDSHAELGEVEHIKRKDVHVHITLTAKETGGEEDVFLGCFKLNPRSTLTTLEQEIQAKITDQKITIFSSLQKPLSNAFGKFTSAAMSPVLELLTLDVPKQIDIRI